MPAARIGKKTTLVFLALLCLACSVVYAEDSAGTIPAETSAAAPPAAALESAPAGATQYSLADTISLALAKSSTVALQELAVKEAELNLKTAQVNLNTTYTAKQLEDAEAALAAAQAQLQLSRDEQALTASERYISVLKAQDTLALADAGVEQAGRQQNLVRERYSAGLATETDVYNADSNLRRAQLTQRQAQAALENERIQFNQLIGTDLRAPFSLINELKQDIPAWDMERDTTQALENRLDIRVLRKNLELPSAT